ncbi:MAG: hypothetical protein JSS90_02360 [Bacteroidetes bacterium]|jgi:hypothetical protein|nr:hypothetical protein [Bacteroidota bacterium]
MELSEIKLLTGFFAKNRQEYLSPPEVYFTDKQYPELLRLYKEITSGKVVTDEEAALKIFNQPASHIPYQKLKSELEDRLVHLVYGLNPEKLMSSMLGRRTFRSYLYVGAALITRQLNTTTLVSDFFSHKLNENAAFTNDAMMQCIADLTLADRMAVKNQPDEFYHFKNKFKDSLERFKMESELLLMQRELDIFQIASNIAQYKNVTTAKKYYHRAKEIHDKFQSFASHYHYTNIAFTYGYFANDFKLIDEILNEREEFYRQHPEYFSDLQRSILAQSRMLACIHLRKYEEGKEEARVFLQKMDQNSADWLLALENYFLLCMHSGNYEQALNIYFEATQSEQFVNFNQEAKERWYYFEPYLNFILPDHFPKESINLLGFLDEITYYTSHKEDNNIIIMIGQIIVMIELGQFDKLLERTMYLETYVQKYVDKRIYPRTFIFLNMMIQLFRNNFNGEKTSLNVQKQFEELKPVIDLKLFNVEGLEIIPYDKLWPEILKKLKKH